LSSAEIRGSRDILRLLVPRGFVVELVSKITASVIVAVQTV
jgi:hypothetical protein